MVPDHLLQIATDLAEIMGSAIDSGWNGTLMCGQPRLREVSA